MKKSSRVATSSSATSSATTTMTLMFLILLGFVMAVTSADKIPSQWLSNLSSFAAGGVGGKSSSKEQSGLVVVVCIGSYYDHSSHRLTLLLPITMKQRRC